MNQRVSPVEDRQHIGVRRSEPHLYIGLPQRKQPAKGALLFEVEDGDGVVLGGLPNPIGSEYQLAGRFDADVEDQIDGPVEHLDEERELLYEAAVPIIRVARGVGCREADATAGALLGLMSLGRGLINQHCHLVVVGGIAREVVVVHRLSKKPRILFPGGHDGIAATAIDVARCDHDGDDHL